MLVVYSVGIQEIEIMTYSKLDEILSSKRIPTIPAVAVEVIKLTDQAETDVNQIAKTIGMDPALTIKVLKTVNSSLYGIPRNVTTLKQAIGLLGFMKVKTLVLGFSLLGTFKKEGEGYDFSDYWKHSLFSAVAAKYMGDKVGLADPDEAFLGGLLQNIGVLVMGMTIPEDYEPILNEVGCDHSYLHEVERKGLGVDHGEVGGKLAEQWNLPKNMAAAIGGHIDPDSIEDCDAQLVKCVALGEKIADVFLNESDELVGRLSDCAGRWFGMSDEDVMNLLGSIHDRACEVKKLFDLPVGTMDAPDEILERANEALINLSMGVQERSEQLVEANEVLVMEAQTDPLTGLSNRRKFDAYIKEHFYSACKVGGCLSMLIIDIDKFKQVNDIYGHQIGDRVLVSHSGLLAQAIGERGLVSRFGGEEFAIVLPGVDEPLATKLAEKIRQMLASSTIVCDAETSINVTASIGVACYKNHNYNDIDQLVRVTDEMLYKAKETGRNRVCVHRVGGNQSRAA